MPVNGTLQVAGFLISALSLILNIMACADRQWRRNDPGKEVIETLIRSTGLWERCTFQATGHYQCDDYDSFFIGLPQLLTGARVFTCVAIVLCLFSSFIGIIGLDCVRVSEDQKMTKAKMAVVGGFLSVLAGVLMCIGCSWFAAEVFQNYYNPMRAMNSGGVRGIGNQYEQYQLEGNEQYIYGRALFIGFASALIGVIGGVLSICSSWGAMNEDDEGFDNLGAYPNQGYTTGNKNLDREYL